ncbi:MAG: tyrosine-type recombinase/integrase [Anaerovoracaceae bacterium]
MVAGHLQKKNNYWYIVLTYKDSEGNPTSKWKSTGLKVYGNKKRAEEMLLQARKDFVIPEAEVILKAPETKSIEEYTFAEFLVRWLEYKKYNVEDTTHAGYHNVIKKWIFPYFSKFSLLVSEIRPVHIQDYIEYCQRKGLSNKSIDNHYGIIKNVFNYAIMLELVDKNPTERIKKPPVKQYIADFYTVQEAKKLLNSVNGTRIEFPVYMAIYYGLRRSEIAGLKWDAINFESRTITIKTVRVTVSKKGEKTINLEKNRPKSETGYRTMPLIEEVEAMLYRIKAQNDKNREFVYNYTDKDAEYIYLKPNGEKYTPGYISGEFKRHLKKNKLRNIRFHDLRHSCASILINSKERISLREIQLWLGHSNYASTLRYAHLQTEAKNEIAFAISKSLG